jgi:hypothetical protein
MYILRSKKQKTENLLTPKNTEEGYLTKAGKALAKERIAKLKGEKSLDKKK